MGGNWKMNGNRASIDEICGWLAAGPLDPAVEVVVGVPGCYLHYVSQKLAATQVAVAAQNCYKAANGAFTGGASHQKQCSAVASVELCRRVIPGHDPGLRG